MTDYFGFVLIDGFLVYMGEIQLLYLSSGAIVYILEGAIVLLF
jgi:hypothetical protein